MTDVPHGCYIDAVNEALNQNGITTIEHYANLNDPLDGAIRIQPVGAWSGYPEVWIGWQAERGWTAVPYLDHSGSKAAMVAELTIATIASPSTVVAEVAALLGVPWSGEHDDRPDLDFPAYEFEEGDPEFDAALAAYR